MSIELVFSSTFLLCQCQIHCFLMLAFLFVNPSPDCSTIQVVMTIIKYIPQVCLNSFSSSDVCNLVHTRLMFSH